MEGTKSKRRHLSVDEWRAMFESFAQRGESLTDFCRREGLSASSFRLWRGRLLGQAGETAELGVAPTRPVAVPGFVDLGALGPAPRAGGGRLELKLELGGGVTLHIVRG